MLLLIAIANIGYWLPVSAADSEQMHRVDQIVTLVRTLMIDQAVYPLFSILLGFGIGVLARRYVQEDLASGKDEVSSRAHAVRRLRMRGALLLAVGAILGLVFSAEILGTYGLVTMLIASLVVNKRRGVMISIACAVVALNLTAMLLAGRLGNPQGATTGPDPTGTSLGMLVLENASMWLLNTVFSIPLSLVVPAVLLGVWVASTDLLSAPQRHRGLLAVLSVLGAAAAAGAVPFGLYVSGFSDQLNPWGLATLSVGGLVTGIGWLALITLLSSFSWVRTSRMGIILAVLGRNSLSGYLAQSLMMAVFSLITVVGGSWSQMSATDGLMVAVLIWTITVAVADGLYVMGSDRPAERLLRSGIARLS